MTPPRSENEGGGSDNGEGSSSAHRSPKRRRTTSQQQLQQPPTSVHAWLHPDTPPPLMTQSPPLHSSSSTFLAFSISFLPPVHITSESTLAKEARRVVRELDVPGLVGENLMDCGEGAFQDGNGKVGKKGKERVREPDHRMWAVRTLCLKERRDGTGGADDYQVSGCCFCRRLAPRNARGGLTSSPLSQHVVSISNSETVVYSPRLRPSLSHPI